MKKLIYIICILIITIGGQTLAEDFVFPVIEVYEISTSSPYRYFYINNSFIFNGDDLGNGGYSLFSIDSRNGDILFEKTLTLPGIIGNKILFSIREGSEKNTYLMNLDFSGKIKYPVGEELIRYDVFDYQNNMILVSDPYTQVSKPPQWFNTETGEMSYVEEDYRNGELSWAEIADISPDKMHLLLKDHHGNVAAIYNIQEKKVVTRLTDHRYRSGFPDSSFMFLTNEIFIIPHGGISLFTIDGEKIGSVIFREEKWGKRSFQFGLSNDFRRGIIHTWYEVEGGQSDRNVLVDTTAFRDWLVENNLLFRPTTAVLNDSRVRVRENPNLEAQHLGYLNTGDEVEVLDRSGIKVQIGDMNDWWYKIKRKSDGLEGWTYGPFLDLAEEQGAIVPPPRPSSGK